MQPRIIKAPTSDDAAPTPLENLTSAVAAKRSDEVGAAAQRQQIIDAARARGLEQSAAGVQGQSVIERFIGSALGVGATSSISGQASDGFSLFTTDDAASWQARNKGQAQNQVAYIPQHYPKWLYHPRCTAVIVASEFEHKAKYSGREWRETPYR